MIKFKYILLLSLLMLISCGPSKRDDSYITPCDTHFSENGERLFIFQFDVILPSSLGANTQEKTANEQQKINLYGAIRAHITAFEKNEGIHCPPGAIAVTDVSDIKCNPATDDNKQFHTIGCTCGTKIVVWSGGSVGTTPALYHELCHLVFGDPNHEDSRWKLWNSRGNEVVESLSR